MNASILLIALFLASAAALVASVWRLRRLCARHDALARGHAELTRRFAPVLDVDRERQRVLAELDVQRAQVAAATAGLAGELAAARAAAAAELAQERRVQTAELATERAWQDLELERARVDQERSALALREQDARSRAELRALQAAIDRLRGELATLDEQSELQAVGLAPPRSDGTDAAHGRSRLDAIRGQLRAHVRDRTAAVRTGEREMNDSKEIDRTLKLMLRAFHAGCDAAIARVRHDNLHASAIRIRRARDAINGLAELHGCVITGPYLELKLAELSLVHSHTEQRQAEKARQRRIREQTRAEQATVRAGERARVAAERPASRRRLPRVHDAKVLLRIEVTGDLGHGDHDAAVEVVHAPAVHREALAALASEQPALTG